MTHDNTGPPGALTSTEAVATYLGRHPTTIRRWVRNGDLGPPPWTHAHLDAVALTKARLSAVSTAPPPSHLALTDAQRRYIREHYSNWPGTPMTVAAICTDLGITRQQFEEFREAEGFTHHSEPVPVVDLLEVPEDDLVDDALEMARGGMARKFARKRAAYQAEAAGRWWAFERSAEALAAALAERLPVRQALPAPACPPVGEGSGLCLVVFPTDLHFGKRGSGLLGPGAYDRATARDRLFGAMTDLWALLPALPERVVVYTGSDGCHIDSAKGTTTKGTPQDLDGTPYEIAVEYVALMYDMVDWWRAHRARVDVRVCPGNHDKFVSRLVHAGMQRTYRDDPYVDVALSMAEYQVWRWGCTSVLTHHGDGRCSTADLAAVFATHFPEEWAAARVRLALRGNLHHTNDDEVNGLRSILLPSLSGQDEYHALKWPISGGLAMRAPLLDREKGLVAIYETRAGT